MKIKTVLTIAMASLMITACSSNNSTTSSQSTDSSVETASNASTENEASSDLVDDGVIDLGTSADFPPFEYYEGQDIVGIDADIAKEISKKIGTEIKFHDMEFSSIIASIESGKLDGGMSGFTVTDERKKQVDFTDYYAESVQKVMVKKDSDIKDIDDLEDKTIGTQLGTTGDMFAQDDFGKDHVQSFAKYSDAVIALESGKVDAMLLDQQTAEKFVSANEDLKLLETDYAKENYSIALSKDNKALYDAINKAIKELKEDGTIDKILYKYIDSEN